MKTWADYEHARRPRSEYVRVPYLTAPSVLQYVESRRGDVTPSAHLAESRTTRTMTPYVVGGSIMDGLRRARYTVRPTRAEREWLAIRKIKAMAAREDVTAVTDTTA